MSIDIIKHTMILDCSRSMVFGDRIIFINPLESPTMRGTNRIGEINRTMGIKMVRKIEKNWKNQC